MLRETFYTVIISFVNVTSNAFIHTYFFIRDSYYIFYRTENAHNIFSRRFTKC